MIMDRRHLRGLVILLLGHVHHVPHLAHRGGHEALFELFSILVWNGARGWHERRGSDCPPPGPALPWRREGVGERGYPSAHTLALDHRRDAPGGGWGEVQSLLVLVQP